MAAHPEETHVIGGVDTHKELHVAAVVDHRDRVLGAETFATTRHGYRLLLARMGLALDLPPRPVRGVAEKCTFCDHRLAVGEDPACVVVCPADARIFGDINDPESKPSQALAVHAPRVLQCDQGTQPHVFYIRDFNS